MTAGFAADLALAGLPPFFLESHQAEWAEVLTPRYGAFLRAAAAVGAQPLSARLRLHATALPPDLGAAARQLAEPVIFEPHAAGWRLMTSWCRVDFDRRTRCADVRGPLHRMAVDLALRHLLAANLDDGLLLHGALLAAGGRAFLACGPSGCGKSTLAALLPEAALCDELAVARREAGGRWRAWSLPFWNGRPGCGVLAGIHLLSHGTRSALSGLPTAEALRRLGPEVVWPAHDEAANGRSLELLGALATEVPVAALAFRPEPAVWNLIASSAA